MTRKTAVAAPGGQFEDLLIDVSANFMEQRGEATPEIARNLLQAVFLATYYAEHEVASVTSVSPGAIPEALPLRGDIAYISMFKHGLRRAAEREGLSLPAVCQLEAPYAGQSREVLLRMSRNIRISTAQTLIGSSTEPLTCDDTQGHDYFAHVYASGETDPDRKAELVRIISEGDFTIPLTGGSSA